MALNISVDLTPKQIEEAIAHYLAAQGLRVKSTQFNATLSYGQMDRGPGHPVFTGAKVQVEPVDKRQSFSSLASQIAAVESDPRPFGDH
jgi:hypothetical protein